MTALDAANPGQDQWPEERAKELGLDIDFRLMDAETLEFPDESFETVISSLIVCTFADPIAALKEMERVCRKDGHTLLLEHGRSDRRCD